MAALQLSSSIYSSLDRRCTSSVASHEVVHDLMALVLSENIVMLTENLTINVVKVSRSMV